MRIIRYVFIIAILIVAKEGFTFRNGAPSGRSGSLGDNGSTCATGGCHGGGPAVTNEQINISSSIPSEGYVSGATYEVSVQMVKAGIGRFGFEISAEDSLGIKVGVLSPIDNRTKNVGSNITHVSSSTDAAGSSTWMMEWTAPSVSVGPVTFSVAGNFANMNNSSSGDVIATERKTFEQESLAIAENDKMRLNLYPNPVANYLHIEGVEVNSISVYTLSGQLVKMYRNISTDVDVSGLAEGSYLFNLETEKSQVSKMILIKRQDKTDW